MMRNEKQRYGDSRRWEQKDCGVGRRSKQQPARRSEEQVETARSEEWGRVRSDEGVASQGVRGA